MTLTNRKCSGFAVVAVIVVTLLGCGNSGVEEQAPDLESSETSQSALVGTEQVDRIQRAITAIPLRVEIDEENKWVHRGVIAGVVRNGEGLSSHFALALGDRNVNPLRVVRDYLPGVRSINVSQGKVNGVGYAFVVGGTGPVDFTRRYELGNQVLDAACIANSGEPCDWLGVPES